MTNTQDMIKDMDFKIRSYFCYKFLIPYYTIMFFVLNSIGKQLLTA